MLNSLDEIEQEDVEIWDAIDKESKRQQHHIELIASENYVSPAVLKAQGSILTNKYAEGYPGKRYYNGCEYIDRIETLAIERAKKLFNCTYANVQPHSGSQANAAVYLALINPQDRILGMDLAHGGHLTHGSKVSFSGKFYQSESYQLDANEKIDYVQLALQAQRYQPKLIIGGFSAYSQHVDWQEMRSIADRVGAYLWVDMAHIAGLVAAGLYPNPLPYAHVVTTTTHKTLAGPRGGMILSADSDTKLHQRLNMSVFPGIQGGPLMQVIAAKAIAFKEAMSPNFVQYQQQVLHNAKTMARIFQQRGYHIVSGGTQNHLFLINLSLQKQSFSGQAASILLEQANITLNKNSVPNDPKSPAITSGLRIGTPAITRRGFKEEACKSVANWICDILDHGPAVTQTLATLTTPLSDKAIGDGNWILTLKAPIPAAIAALHATVASIKSQAKALCQHFPFYNV